MRYRYGYKDFSCSFCAGLSGRNPRCPHPLYPHIMDNLEDLAHDPAFFKAVADAGSCGDFHRPALLYLGEGPALCCV